MYHHSAGRRHPTVGEKKFNDWCAKKGGPVNIGWCKTHCAYETQVTHDFFKRLKGDS
jgi:hypothetical protein